MRIAIEPVIAPAASLIAISSALEAIESAAAPLLVRIIARSWLAATAEVRGQQPSRPAAVADLVLLGLAQLRHRALVVGPGGVGDEGRVVAKAALAARLARSGGPRSAPRRPARSRRLRPGPARSGRPLADHRRRPSTSRSSFVEVLLVARASARRSGRSRSPARPPSAVASIPESSPIAASPVAACAARAFSSAMAGEGVTLLGRQLDPRREAAPARAPGSSSRISRSLCLLAWRRSTIATQRQLPAPAPGASARSPSRPGRAAHRARRERAACARPSPAPRPVHRRRS